MGNIKVRNSGVFAQMKNVKARSGGSLVQAQKIAIRSGGVWVTALEFVPEVPVLTATNTNAYTNTLSWTAPASVLAITNYSLQRSPDNSTWTTIFTSSTRTYVDSGLTQNTTYYYRVRANTAVNSGPYSTVSTQATRVATVKRQTFTSTGTWTKPTGVTVADVLVVAGGQGGGGSDVPNFTGYPWNIGGGGGAGQVIYSTNLSVTSASSYTCTVGAGGSGGPIDGDLGETTGSKGGNSSFGTLITALGDFSGAGGTTGNDGSQPTPKSGKAGANGGTSGANGVFISTTDYRGGGGGGAGGAGSGSTGGSGISNSISGSSVTYGVGGNAAVGYYSSPSSNACSIPTPPAANTGSGGAARSWNSAQSHNGAAGIVIVSWFD
jgi:hypothetical protein